MTDYFSLFDEPRRPWLDPNSLNAKFLTRSAQWHPDLVHNSAEPEQSSAARRYAELNAAFSCLRDPKERVAHLLQLELGAKPKDLQQMPDDLAEMFMQVAQLCRQTDALLAEKAHTTSPLLRVLLFERGHAWIEKLNGQLAKLTNRCELLTERLKVLDARWQTTLPGSALRQEVLSELEELYRQFGFFTRWSGQIQERLVQLAV
jgi:curved DNA-binding protein CbpA